MNFKLCHTCKYEHSRICCSGCEQDNDEYVQAEWFTKKEGKIRADERRKFAEWLIDRIHRNSLQRVLSETKNFDIMGIDNILSIYEKEQKND